jgi:signal transduction histidine kinase
MQERMTSWRRQILWCLGVNSLASLMMPAFIWVLNPGVSSAVLLEYFKHSVVYAQVIGSLAYFTTAAAWQRLSGLHPVGRWTAISAILTGDAVAGSLLAGLIVMALGWMRPAAYWIRFWATLKFCILVTLEIGIAMEIYGNLRSRLEKTSLALREKDLERERALKLATEAKLAALQARLHPHFLFNALNSISALIQEDPVRADQLVERMAALLRAALDSSQEGLIPLADELKLVVDYLEVEKARFGDRLSYQVQVPEEVLPTRVPPLSLQTMVENSVKYAVAPVRGGGDIRISGHVVNGQVQVEVSDSGPGFRLETVPAGHGLDNLRARLGHFFGDGPHLTATKQEGRGQVRMSIPRGTN